MIESLGMAETTKQELLEAFRKDPKGRVGAALFLSNGRLRELEVLEAAERAARARWEQQQAEAAAKKTKAKAKDGDAADPAESE